MMRVWITLLALVTSLASAGSAEEWLASGLVLLNEAVQARVAEPDHAARLGADAAVLIRAAMDEKGIDSAAGQRALGTAWLLAGETGRAILAFRRAELIAPDDVLIRSSLSHARAAVGAQVGSVGTERVWRRIAVAWRGEVPRGAMFWGGLGVFVACCWVLGLRLLGAVPAKVTWPAAAMGLLGAAALGVLAAEPVIDGWDAAAVVLQDAPARTGPHPEVYPPALDAPVPAGTEVRVLESRDGWVRCAVGGLEAWIPGDAIERVRAVPTAGS